MEWGLRDGGLEVASRVAETLESLLYVEEQDQETMDLLETDEAGDRLDFLEWPLTPRRLASALLDSLESRLRAGRLCAAPPVRGQTYCKWHAPWAKEAARRGGLVRKASYPPPDPIKPARALPDRPLTVRQRIWLTAYTSQGGTFGNASAAARIAYPCATPGCAAVLGHRLTLRLKPELDAWFKENGMDFDRPLAPPA